MDAYRFKSVDAAGRIQTGVLTARNEQEIVGILRERNQSPISIVAAEKKSKDLGEIPLFKKKVKLVDISLFCRQLSTMLRAGMPLDRAMTTQVAQTQNPVLKETLTQVSAKIRQGHSLTKALGDHKDVFPDILVNMVASGEMTGELDTALERMSVHFNKEYRINRQIKGSMIYPIALLILTIIVAVGLIIFVIPIFAGMFESAGSQLPGLTQFMVNISNSMRSFWYIYLGIVIAAAYLLKKWKRSPKGKHTIDSLKLRLPVVHKLMTQVVTARFTRTLSTLLSSGVSLPEAMGTAGDTTNNEVVKERVAVATEDLKRGAVLSQQLQALNLFPHMMVAMISIGEETGDLDNMLSKTADFYDEEFDTAISKLTKLIEPCMIVFMAGIIGFIVIAMYLPLFEVVNTVQ